MASVKWPSCTVSETSYGWKQGNLNALLDSKSIPVSKANSKSLCDTISTPWRFLLSSRKSIFIYNALWSLTPKSDECLPPVPSEVLLCSVRFSGASMSACWTSWRTLGCPLLWMVFSILIMTWGWLTHLWSTDLWNSNRKILESNNTPYYDQCADAPTFGLPAASGGSAKRALLI